MYIYIHIYIRLIYLCVYIYHLRLVKAPRRVPFPTIPFPMVGKVKHSLFGLVQPKTEGHSVLSQLFD